MKAYLKSLSITLFISLIGGYAFFSLHIPLAWILGPIAFLLLYKSVWKKETVKSQSLRNIAFVLLGIQIGSTFTTHTVQAVAPYFLPFLILTFLTIVVAISSGYFLSKITNIDKMTSILGAIPGGLSAMIALSESFKGKTIYVTLFHSIRLLAVLFIIPFIATHFFMGDQVQNAMPVVLQQNGQLWTVIFYVVFFFVAKYCSRKVPASYVIVPMILTAIMNGTGFTMYHLPVFFFIGAQIILGADLGHSVSVKDILNAGRYCFYYFILNIGVIFFTIVIGYLFTLFTPMNLVTAILSFAPGGLVEMALTAQEVGGDPSVVGSLQMIRLLIIVLLLPFLLQWVMPKLEKKQSTPSMIEKSM